MSATSHEPTLEGGYRSSRFLGASSEACASKPLKRLVPRGRPSVDLNGLRERWTVRSSVPSHGSLASLSKRHWQPSPERVSPGRTVPLNPARYQALVDLRSERREAATPQTRVVHRLCPAPAIDTSLKDGGSSAELLFDNGGPRIWNAPGLF